MTVAPAQVSRKEQLDRLANEAFDLVVVGGGITGAGVALDAATRGLRVALVERQDFAAGTSSRTTKLIHGGLRYMAQGQLGVTRDASIERRMLLQLAPHLVHPLPFLVPLSGLRDRLMMTAALTGYDFLASFQNVRNHHRLDQRELLRWYPALRGADYRGALVYYDGQTDDARLTVTVLKEALRYGACAVNYCAAVGFAGNGHVDRVHCRDMVSGAEFPVQAGRVVLACGVWLDEALALMSPEGIPPHPSFVKPAKGVHLVLPRQPFGDRAALLLRHPRDGRYVFVLPWKERTFVGTTDTAYSGDLSAPPVKAADVRYLLQVVNAGIPGAHMRESDVIGVQAGLRPLINVPGRAPDAISREDKLTVTSNGTIAIAGGKLTTFRHMAEKAVDLAGRLLHEDGSLASVPACRTRHVPLGGFPLGATGELGREEGSRQLSARLPKDVAAHLLASYGAGALRIAVLADETPALAERLVDDLPVIKAEARYAVEAELAVTLGDVLTRRLGLTLLDPKGAVRCAPAVAALLGPALGWDEQERARQLDAFKEEAAYFTWGPRPFTQ